MKILKLYQTNLKNYPKYDFGDFDPKFAVMFFVHSVEFYPFINS